MTKVGDRFEMHSKMKYRDESGVHYHEFDSECVVTKVGEFNAEYEVIRQFNETCKPSWQTAEMTTTKGGFSLRFHKIMGGKLVSVNQVAGECKMPIKKSARLLP